MILLIAYNSIYLPGMTRWEARLTSKIFAPCPAYAGEIDRAVARYFIRHLSEGFFYNPVYLVYPVRMILDRKSMIYKIRNRTTQLPTIKIMG